MRSCVHAAFVAALLVWTSCPVLPQEGPSVLVVDSPYEPYVYGDVGEEATRGVGVDIAHEVFRRLGLDYEHHLHPWRRTLRMLEVGEADAVPLIMKTEKRLSFLVFTDPVLASCEMLYYSVLEHPGFTWGSYRDLRGYTIGLVEGFAYGERFMESIDRLGLRVERANDSDSNIRKLINGRVDLILEDQHAAAAILARYPGSNELIASAPPAITEYSYHMGISRKSPLIERIDEINEVIASIQTDGTIDEILALYR